MQWHMSIGYKVVNGNITVYEEHRKIVEEIFRDYDSGISSLTKISFRRVLFSFHLNAGFYYLFCY